MVLQRHKGSRSQEDALGSSVGDEMGVACPERLEQYK